MRKQMKYHKFDKDFLLKVFNFYPSHQHIGYNLQLC